MLKWGLWEQLDESHLRLAWARLCRDKGSGSEGAPQFSPLWVLLSLGRQVYLMMIGQVTILQIIDNLFLEAFCLGVYYHQAMVEDAGLDRLTTDERDKGGADDAGI